MMTGFEIRALSEGDEASARAAHAELAAEGFVFLQDLRPGESWKDYVNRVATWPRGEGLPDRWVPATFRAALVADHVVGRMMLRHTLTPFLAEVGGHIGYAVRPQYRRRGCAAALMSHGLAEARDLGLPRVLLTCDMDNDASAALIVKSGGRYEGLSQRVDGSPVKRRFWIDL